MAGNKVTLTFAGDSKSLERSFATVGSSAKNMAADLDVSAQKAGLASRAIDGAGGAADASEGKFMAAADVLDGLGSAFGLPTGAATGMMRAFGDLSGGFAGLSGMFSGGIEKIKGFTAAIMDGSAFTKAWTGVQAAFNAVMSLNPAILITAAIVALGVAIYVAYQKSETFRNIVKGAFETVRGAAESLLNFFKGIPEWLGSAGTRIKDAVLWPYKTAFNGIANLWNNTVGQLSFKVPSWVPGIGGKGFSMPQLPTFHVGGVVPGNPGQAVPIMAMAGETVTRAGQGGGDTYIINAGAIVTEQGLADLVHRALLRKQARAGNLGFTAA